MKLFRKIFVIIAVVFVFGAFLSKSASALDPNPAANAAQGIEISPALVELNAARGQTYNVNLDVMNVTASELNYTSSTDDFGAADESGSPKVDLTGSLPPAASIKTWVQMIPEFTLKSRKSTVVNVQITIPNDAEPGGHYGVVRFSGSAPEVADNGVGLAASAGVLILIRVDGVINESANLASFYTAAGDKQSWFFENSPIKFVTRIQNDGNIHVKPTGVIEVHDMFGGLVSTIPVNAEKGNVLPSSIRRFEGDLNKDWMFGRYKASLTLGYGTTGQAITATAEFWVIPYKLILAALFLSATVIFILIRLIKVYNNYIIRKAKNEPKIKKTKNQKK